MAKKNELPALIISLLVTVGILGAGAWWLLPRVIGGGDGGSGEVVETPSNRSANTGLLQGADGTSGETILPSAPSETKRRGLEALAAQDYAAARSEFEAALAENRNDPESLIYLNNAEIGADAAYSIAVVVPAFNNLNPSLEIMRGVAQAQQEINESGGISGTPLKVLLLNDEGNLETAEGIAAALVDSETVLGVVGHYSSDITLAAAAIYEAGGLPVISPTSTAVRIADAGDYVFRTVPSDRLAAKALAGYVLNELDKQRAAIFYTAESTYSQSVKEEFEREFIGRGDVVADFDVSEPGFSAGNALGTAQAAEADVLVLALTADTEAKSLQILSVNRRELPVVGGDDLYDFNILDTGREDAVGLTVAVPWHILSHQNSPFVRASQQLWGASVNWRTVTAYDAVKALAAAIETGGDSREEIQAALSDTSLRIDGATDEIRFFPDGDRTQPSALVSVEERPNGPSGTGYDYIPVQ